MRTLRSLLAVLVLAAGMAWVTAGTAFACSCAGQGVAAHLEGSDVVLVGSVVDVRPPPWRPVMSSGDLATYELAVESVFKGDVVARTYVQSASSGASCGIEVDRGERYVLFADVERTGGLGASLCGGTAPAAPGLVERVEALAGAGRVPDPPGTVGVVGAEAPPRSLITGWSVLGAGLSLLGVLAGLLARHRRLR